MRPDPAIEWLVHSPEPAIRRLARRDLLGEEVDPADVDGPMVSELLRHRPVHPYAKWSGVHWRLVSLVELGIELDESRAAALVEPVLAWLTGPGHRRGIKTIDGLVRRCASQEGNALAVCSRLGLAGDERVELIARSLVDWQWPDGGWNCDPRASGRRSSFHESLAPAWGLHEYFLATGATWAADAAGLAAELFLQHRIFRTLRTGEPVHPTWLVLHYPPYWHYDVLQALLILSRLGLANDPRAVEAVEIVVRARRSDGLWHAGAGWWRAPGTVGSNVEVVDWGRRGPSAMMTLNALRVLQAAA